jgi:hypothetical protein
MRTKIMQILWRGHDLATARPRDDSGAAHESLITAGFVIAGGVLVAAVAAYVNNQVGFLGG